MSVTLGLSASPETHASGADGVIMCGRWSDSLCNCGWRLHCIYISGRCNSLPCVSIFESASGHLPLAATTARRSHGLGGFVICTLWWWCVCDRWPGTTLCDPGVFPDRYKVVGCVCGRRPSRAPCGPCVSRCCDKHNVVWLCSPFMCSDIIAPWPAAFRGFRCEHASDTLVPCPAWSPLWW